MDFYNGLSDFKPGDIVNVIKPPAYDMRTYGFGIYEHQWQKMIDTNPHKILQIQEGCWRGYQLSDCEINTGSDLVWPSWGLILTSEFPMMVSVDDLL